MKKRIFTTSLIGVLFFGLFTPVYATGRDCDGNAIIRCGTLSVSELQDKVDSNSQVRSIYHTIGIRESQFGRLKNGVVKKDGTVWVGDKKVASNVFSAGRHFITGSTRDNRFSTPVYWRHPHVSFLSDSLSAFVYLNSNGTFGYAIIKACGNPVTLNFNANIKETPPPPPPPTPRFNLTVNKFEDRNTNGRKDTGERMLSGWEFTVTGNGINKKASTSASGQVTFTGLLNGNYTVTETTRRGWSATTKNPLGIKINNADTQVWFGNRQIPVVTQTLRTVTINKFEDLNSNRIKDANEPMLSGWNFRITGTNDFNQTGTTNQNGQLIFTGLPAGFYTVTEDVKSDWTPTTSNPLNIRVGNENLIVWFGNKKKTKIVPATIETKEIVSTKGQPASLPETGAAGILGALGLTSLGTAAFHYRRSKKMLKKHKSL